MANRGDFEGVSRLVSFLITPHAEGRRDFLSRLFTTLPAAELAIPVIQATLEQARLDEQNDTDITPAELENVFRAAVLHIQEAWSRGQKTLLDVAGVHFPPDGHTGIGFDRSAGEAWRIGAKFATVGNIEPQQVDVLNNYGVTVITRPFAPFNTVSYDSYKDPRYGVLPAHFGKQNLLVQQGNEINGVEPFFDFYTQTLTLIVPESEFAKHGGRERFSTYQNYLEQLVRSYVEQHLLTVAKMLSEEKNKTPIYNPKLLLTPMAAGSTVDEFKLLEVMLKTFVEVIEAEDKQNPNLHLTNWVRDGVALGVHPYTFSPYESPLSRFAQVADISWNVFGRALPMYATEAGFLKGAQLQPVPPRSAAATLLNQLSASFNQDKLPIRSYCVWNLANTGRRLPGGDPSTMEHFDKDALIDTSGQPTESFLQWERLVIALGTRKNLQSNFY